MLTENPTASFELDGFLSDGITAEIQTIRQGSRDWFLIATDLNRTLQSAAIRAMKHNHGGSFGPSEVATRLLLRSCGAFQGAILMAERGMIAEAQTLARTLLENAFCIAALATNPDKFIALMKADSNAARRNRANFILAQGLLKDEESASGLKAVAEAIGKQLKLMSPKAIAAMGPISSQYLAYQKLSDEAAHPTSTSLHRHVALNEADQWCYRWGPGTDDHVSLTLNHAVLAALPIGIGVTQITKDDEHSARFNVIAERLLAMPKAKAQI